MIFRCFYCWSLLWSLFLCVSLLLSQPSESTTPATSRRAASDSSTTSLHQAARHLKGSIDHQIKEYSKTESRKGQHRKFLQQSYGKPKSTCEIGSLSYYIRIGLAGGFAGATGTALLYPVDSAKTLRQSNPSRFASVRDAFETLIYSKNQWHIQRAYRGLIPATLGAIPSSALYFGAYESMKTLIQSQTCADKTKYRNRLWVHALSAAAGNVMSSLVFVPKELIKQQMQYMDTNVGSVCVRLLREQGIRGLYSGYQATLMRNIPSAMLRFVVYEELKWAWYTKDKAETKGDPVALGFDWKLFAAGAVAGALASGFMTPIDVLKTRLSTGTCPVDVNPLGCAQHVIRETGWGSLYAGAGSRMVWSGAFSAIGFGSLEAAKGWLGVADPVRPAKKTTKPSKVRMFSMHSRALQHALSGEASSRKQ